MNSTALPRVWPHYRTVWRWHFYAGLFCIPFVLVLATTGTIYLFKPQLEAWIDRPFDTLQLDEGRVPADQIIQNALAAFPGAALEAYELPPTPSGAARILLREDGKSRRVYVHPATGAVLHAVWEEERLLRVVRRIHGTLLIGERGSHLVELAACWTVVMIVTGLVLWWPRNAQGWGGLLFPRWCSGTKVLLKDLHSVTGMWVSGLALFLIFTGLPWANLWGSYFRFLRTSAGAVVSRQDWSQGGSAEPTAASEHQHSGGGSQRRGGRRSSAAMALTSEQLATFPLAIAEAERQQLAAPAQVSIDRRRENCFTIQSLAQNRTLRVELTYDAATGKVITQQGFADRPVLDQVVSVGIAAHEGQLFGPLNQLLGVLATSGLVLLSVSGLWMWWRRRTPGTLGAPAAGPRARVAWSCLACVVVLAVALPMFGLSLIAVWTVERTVLRSMPQLRTWLGLSSA